MKEKFNSYIYMISAVAVLFSSALYIVQPFYMRYIFAVGAAGMAVSRLALRYEGGNLRLRRLYRLQKFAPLMIVGASYFMFKDPIHNQWIPLLLIAALIELYTSFIIGKTESKPE